MTATNPDQHDDRPPGAFKRVLVFVVLGIAVVLWVVFVVTYRSHLIRTEEESSAIQADLAVLDSACNAGIEDLERYAETPAARSRQKALAAIDRRLRDGRAMFAARPWRASDADDAMVLGMIDYAQRTHRYALWCDVNGLAAEYDFCASLQSALDLAVPDIFDFKRGPAPPTDVGIQVVARKGSTAEGRRYHWDVAVMVPGTPAHRFSLDVGPFRPPDNLVVKFGNMTLRRADAAEAYHYLEENSAGALETQALERLSLTNLLYAGAVYSQDDKNPEIKVITTSWRPATEGAVWSVTLENYHPAATYRHIGFTIDFQNGPKCSGTIDGPIFAGQTRTFTDVRGDRQSIPPCSVPSVAHPSFEITGAKKGWWRREDEMYNRCDRAKVLVR